MDSKREMKKRNESDIGAISTPSPLVTRKKGKKRKNRKESDGDEIPALNKKVDQIGNCLNELTGIVKKLNKNSEMSSKEKEIPKKVEYECLFENEDSDMGNGQTIFVRGFDCSFPIDDIKSTLTKHFSSCGEVWRVFLPYECKTGSPLGFGFVNMIRDAHKGLALNGTYLGGMRLQVTMAIDRTEYYGFTNFSGCERCGRALNKRRMKRFQENFGRRITPPPGAVFKTPKQNDEAK
ncbi:unnamed protein product [Arabis nemorensis]|uniref:RRM domain-containing protein n=1 Tax=Arabis nemorensis TaxID=586526 RepID=A0A565C7G7_9BRAS|nr:unnamed protein product [Arabis nemorensis]